MDVRTLTIDQTAVAKAEISLIKCFVLSLDKSLSLRSDELMRTLTRLEEAGNLLLKTVDSAFSSFLTVCFSSLKDADQLQRALFVKDLESKFQSQRETAAGQKLLDLILAPLLDGRSPNEIWIPGCGEGYEAAWIEGRFPKATHNYLDVNLDALNQTKTRLNTLKSVAKVTHADLTQTSALPDGQPDLVLFFNPFVIEHPDYQRIVMTLSDKKLTDSKAEAYLSNLSMSLQSQKIFDNILARMKHKHFVSVTMDLAEAHAIFNFFQSRHVSVACYRNPYAIKNLASHILGKRSPRTEPKIYHYVLIAEAK